VTDGFAPALFVAGCLSLTPPAPLLQILEVATVINKPGGSGAFDLLTLYTSDCTALGLGESYQMANNRFKANTGAQGAAVRLNMLADICVGQLSAQARAWTAGTVLISTRLFASCSLVCCGMA
jgi:hypothetical protein